ncbi:MAG: O-antigen polysaccharide polymerase Wzy [Lentisphaeria bacterium]|nr:O-antigen polysaccharide polymerase Wzy [Lentisphaeria bacterium]
MPAVFRTDQKKKTGSMILKSFFLLQLLGLLCWYWHGDFGYSTGVLLTFVSMSFVNCILFFHRTGKYCNKSFHIIIFCLGYLIVFFQNYIEILLGNLAVEDIRYSIASPEDVICSAAMSTMGLLGMFLGVLLMTPPKQTAEEPRSEGVIADSSVRLPGQPYWIWGAFLLFFAFNREYLFNTEYSQELLESRSFVSNAVHSLFQSVCIVFLAYNCNDLMRRKKKVFAREFFQHIGWHLNMAIFLFISCLMVGGDRGGALPVILAYCAAFLLVSRFTFRYKYLLILSIIGGIFFGFVAQMRTTDKSAPLLQRVTESINFFKSAGKGSERVYSPTAELAGSVATFHNVVSYIPQFHPFFYGYFNFLELASIVPGVGRAFRTFYPGHFKYWGASYFCTWLFFGDNYPMGTGTSWNADLYMNFGLSGIVLGMFLWGIFLAFLRNKMLLEPASVSALICYLVIAGTALYSNRATIMYFAPILVHSCILYFLYNFFFISRKNNRKDLYKSIGVKK